MQHGYERYFNCPQSSDHVTDPRLAVLEFAINLDTMLSMVGEMSSYKKTFICVFCGLCNSTVKLIGHIDLHHKDK